jgi:indole-3-glycerol phosphate synthase
MTMSTVLDKIVASKRQEVAQSKSAVPESELRRRVLDAPPVRDLARALDTGSDMHVIAEIKRASPSAGLLRSDFDPVAIAAIYEAHGASAISVLTDAPFFQGSLAHLSAARAAVELPVLRKDFVLDTYQIVEARAAGADAVLLIAEILPGAELGERLHDSRSLGMEPLVELHDADNLVRVIESGARIIGINNRNLRTFATDLSHTIDLAREVPPDRILVSESGIGTRSHVQQLLTAGVRAILVGENLMRARDIGGKLDELLHD